jgi:hypothetical protein
MLSEIYSGRRVSHMTLISNFVVLYFSELLWGNAEKQCSWLLWHKPSFLFDGPNVMLLNWNSEKSLDLGSVGGAISILIFLNVGQFILEYLWIKTSSGPPFFTVTVANWCEDHECIHTYFTANEKPPVWVKFQVWATFSPEFFLHLAVNSNESE